MAPLLKAILYLKKCNKNKILGTRQKLIVKIKIQQICEVY